MAIAKTPKPAPAAKTAAAKPVTAKPAVAKPAAARAAAAKPDEEAVVHSAIVTEPPAAQKTVETAAVTAKATEAAAVETVTKPAKAVAVLAKATHESAETMLKGVVPLLDFSRENAILMVSAGNEFALGLHKLSQSLIDWSAESCDKSVAASQAMLSAKTVEEVLDLSQSLARDSLQQLLKEGSELSALSTKLIEDTIVPLPGRLAAAVEKLASRAA